MGFSLKRIFSNPVKTLVDVGTFGGTFVTREVIGAKKLANNVTRVYAATGAGIVSGFATGGVPGAFAGGAAGFGRGVAAAAHGEDINLKLLGEGAKYGAIVGGVTGLVRGAAGATLSQQFQSGGAAGILRNAVVGSASKVPALPALKLPSLAGVSAAVLSASTLLNSLHPGTSNVNVAPPDNPNAGTGVINPTTLNVGNPSAVPSAAPSSGMPSSIVPVLESSPFPWWALAVAGGLVFIVMHKKRGF